MPHVCRWNTGWPLMVGMFRSSDGSVGSWMPIFWMTFVATGSQRDCGMMLPRKGSRTIEPPTVRVVEGS